MAQGNMLLNTGLELPQICKFAIDYLTFYCII